MKFSAATILAAITSAVVATPIAAPAESGETPDPSTVQIKGLTYNGSGCPIGTVSTILTGDRQSFTLIMSEYIAAIGPGTAVKDRVKNCQINIDLSYPNGWQYSLFTASYRGSAGLEAGVTGTQSAVYYFTGAGSSQQCSASTSIKGPYNDNYLIVDRIGVESLVWSPCRANGKLNINSIVRLASTKSTASGYLTTDSVDGNFKQIYGVQWRRC